MPADETASELLRAAEFRTAVRRFLLRTDQAAAAAGLTSQRYDLLLMIKSADGGRSTVTELARRLYLAQPAATELVKRAVASGLVERSVSEHDRRVTLLRLTPEGERRLTQAFVALRDDRREAAAALRTVGSTLRVLGSGQTER